ncbi:MAG: hypothetical protein ACE5MI_10775 [Acidimicrobiia bacterium]
MESVPGRRIVLAGLLTLLVAVLATGAFLTARGLAGQAGRAPTPPELTKESQALVLQAEGPIHEGLLANYLVSTDSPPSGLLTREQEELVRWALWRFSAAGLELPEVDIFFQNDTMSCGGRQGLYHTETATLYLCTPRKQTILHELAHAWTEAQLSEERRTGFVEFRGVRSWDSRSDPWELRATEHASEIITWALMDRPIHVPTQPAGPGGETIFQLLSIPKSDVDALALGYEFLTGTLPPFRHASEWEEILQIGNPELRYAR